MTADEQIVFKLQRILEEMIKLNKNMEDMRVILGAIEMGCNT